MIGYVTLGTNDLKVQFGSTAQSIAAGVRILSAVRRLAQGGHACMDA